MALDEIMGKQDFLKLFITQVQYQNPLDPMKNEDFTQQLALFSTVEQLENLNKAANQMLDFQISTISALAVGLIGKEITSSGNQFVLTEDGQATELGFYLSGDAAKVDITVLDENGKVVRLLDLYDLSGGKHTFTWDGRDLDGNSVEAGNYRFQVAAKDSQGNGLQVETFQRGIVSGLTFEDGVTYLDVNGKQVTLAEIITIRSQEG